MSGESDFTKARFHKALGQAVRRHCGPDWALVQPNEDSWTIAYELSDSIETKRMEFRFYIEQHHVGVTLGISRDRNVIRPTVWWADRDKHPTLLAFANVIWHGRRYGNERTYSLPKDATLPNFSQSIDEMVSDVLGRADEWFSEAQVELNDREGT